MTEQGEKRSFVGSWVGLFEIHEDRAQLRMAWRSIAHRLPSCSLFLLNSSYQKMSLITPNSLPKPSGSGQAKRRQFKARRYARVHYPREYPRQTP